MTDFKFKGNLPTEVKKLEDPEGYQEWSRALRLHLVSCSLWDYTQEKQKTEPTQTENEAASAFADRLILWHKGHELAINSVQYSLGRNYAEDYEGYDNAYTLWTAIASACKLKGSGTLNDLYRQLIQVDLRSCDGASDYIAKFKSILTSIHLISPALKLETNFLIFLFHTGLGKPHNQYYTNYTQTHAPLKDKLDPNDATKVVGQEAAYSLEYATNRFLQTVKNPPSNRDDASTAYASESVEAYLAGQFPGPKPGTTLKTLAPQAEAIDGPEGRWTQKLVKFCTICRKEYHIASECHTLTKKGGRGQGSRINKGKKDQSKGGKSKAKKDKDSSKGKGKRPHSDTESEPETYIASEAFAAPTHVTPVRWVLDNACSQHLSKDRDAFTTFRALKPSDNIGPMGGLGGKLSPVGIGKVEIHCNIGGKRRTLCLSEVLYIPDSPVNLISFGQLVRNGCPFKLISNPDKNGIEIGTKGITAWMQSNNLFYLPLWSEPEAFAGQSHLDGHLTTDPDVPKSGVEPDLSADVEMGDAENAPPQLEDAGNRDRDTNEDIGNRKERSVNSEAMKLWHQRLGHLGEANIKRLAQMSKGMDLYHKPSKVEVCEACAIAKSKSEPHKCPIRPGRFFMDLVHTDVAGPFGSSRDGYRWFVTFLDDWSKHSSVSVVKSRDEYLTELENFRLRNERAEFRIHRIRSDNELESNGFIDWRKEHGVAWEPTTRGTPEQNGAAERLNQTLVATIRTMIEASEDLDWSLWPELIQAAVYIRNRCPIDKRDKTPYELVTGSKPDLAHIRAVGTQGYALKRKPQNGFNKTDTRATLGTLVGFKGDHQFYMLMHNDNRVYKVSSVKWRREREPEDDNAPAEGEEQSISPAGSTMSRPQPYTKDSPVTVRLPTAQPMSVTFSRRHPRGTLPHPNEQGTLPYPNVIPPSNAPKVSVVVPNRTAGNRYTLSTSSNSSPGPDVPSSDTLDNSSDTLEELQFLPDPLGLFALIADANPTEPFVPKTYKQAINSDWRLQWLEAMQEEINSLIENETWTLSDAPSNRSVLRGRWVFALKRGPNGEITRFKARWVVRGFEQRPGLDYNETFASVVKPMSYKAIFALAAAHDWDIEQMDVKTAFLYGYVKEDIWVEQPHGFGKSRKVCKLNRALYGLKQSPRVWYETFAAFMKELGIVPVDSDYGIFINHTTGTLIALYVDDILITGPSREDISKVKAALNAKFRMTDLGPCAYYLGMTVTRDRPNRILRLGQAAYVERVIKQFDMWEAAPKLTPMVTSSKLVPAEDDYTPPREFLKRYQSAVGSLMYAMLGTRPDIAYAVSVVSRFASKPTDQHWGAVKHILRYLKHTLHYQLTYQGGLGALQGYTDSDWGGDTHTRRSTAGYVFNIGSGALSWSSKRQPTVALSSCEAEYFGQTQATKEAIWLKKLLAELNPGDEHPKTVVLYGDNQGAIAMSKDPLFHPRTKHVAIQLKWQREKVAEKEVDIQWIPTDKMVADGLTKPVDRVKFEAFRKAIGLEEYISRS